MQPGVLLYCFRIQNGKQFIAPQLREAIGAFELAQKQMPGDSKPILLQADCYLRIGDNKKVIELLSQLEQQSGDEPGITYMLGTALVRDGQSDKGQILIDKILR